MRSIPMITIPGWRKQARQEQAVLFVSFKDLYDFSSQQKLEPKYNTDWQDVLYDNVMVTRHNLSFAGGNNGVRYMVSGGYLDQPGILNSTYQKGINLRTNIDADVSPKLKISSSVFITNTKESRSTGRPF